MALFDALPPKIAALFVVVAIAYIACMASPLLLAALVAKWRQPALPRRWLFAVVLLIGSYGLLTAIGFLAIIPVQAYLVFISPQLDAADLVQGGPLTNAADFLATYWWLLYGPALLMSSIGLCRYLLPKWRAIIAALEG